MNMYMQVCIYYWNTWENHHIDKLETQLHKRKQSLPDYFHTSGHCFFLHKINITKYLLCSFTCYTINSLELWNFLNLHYICNTSIHVY